MEIAGVHEFGSNAENGEGRSPGRARRSEGGRRAAMVAGSIICLALAAGCGDAADRNRASQIEDPGEERGEVQQIGWSETLIDRTDLPGVDA
ncbi:MAG: hypothetical protein ABEL76_17205 [Bradymonadaceae bacterium]